MMMIMIIAELYLPARIKLTSDSFSVERERRSALLSKSSEREGGPCAFIIRASCE